MRIIADYCAIADVIPVEPKGSDNQKKDKKVILHIDEEDFFNMLDNINSDLIIKYLDDRKIPHRELTLEVTDCKVVLTGRCSKEQDDIRKRLYIMNKQNRKKLNQALEILRGK